MANPNARHTNLPLRNEGFTARNATVRPARNIGHAHPGILFVLTRCISTYAITPGMNWGTNLRGPM